MKLTIKEIINNAIDEMQRARETIGYLHECVGEPIGDGKAVTDDEMLIEDMNNSIERLATILCKEEIEEVNEMKKYTIENYEEFSRVALDAPPMEEFENGTIDEDKWYEENKIIITKGKHQMELEYNADNVNELDTALREMYEVEMDIRSATTGNTVGNQYRPAELKDIIRIAIQNDWDKDGWRMGDFSTFIRHFINQIKDISDVMSYYKIIQEDYKDATDRCKCDFSKLDMSTMRINPKTIRDTISELICTDRELLYGVTEDDKSSDIVFVMDYTLKLSGELIGWFYGEPDDEYINGLIADYKKKLFGEEN